MFLVTSNKLKQLLCLSFIQHVGPDELRRGLDEVKLLLGDLQPRFRVLVDFSQLDSMDVECTVEIGRAMELIDQSGVGLVVRLIPDSSKDIGMNILAIFHYAHRPRIVTCANMLEAAKALSL